MENGRRSKCLTEEDSRAIQSVKIILILWQECQYAMNPATHLDFLIYNRIGKKPVLAIEDDGYEYHKEDTVQASRDLLKNHIMELYEISLLRFKTNGSSLLGAIREAKEEVDLGKATTDEVAQVVWMNRERIKELFQQKMFVDTLEYFFTEVDKQ